MRRWEEIPARVIIALGGTDALHKLQGVGWGRVTLQYVEYLYLSLAWVFARWLVYSNASNCFVILWYRSND